MGSRGFGLGVGVPHTTHHHTTPLRDATTRLATLHAHSRAPTAAAVGHSCGLRIQLSCGLRQSLGRKGLWRLLTRRARELRYPPRYIEVRAYAAESCCSDQFIIPFRHGTGAMTPGLRDARESFYNSNHSAVAKSNAPTRICSDTREPTICPGLAAQTEAWRRRLEVRTSCFLSVTRVIPLRFLSNLKHTSF